MKKEMPSVRELKNEDIPNVIELLNMVFSEQGYFETPIDNSWWKWRYELSPFGEPIHLVAENSSGKIVGFRSFWPWELIYEGMTLKAYQPQATVVHPSFRRIGIFREMNLAALNKAKEEGADILFNFPNQASLPGNISMGWHFVSKIPWLVKPLRPLAIARSCFSRDKARPLELGKDYELKEKHCLKLTGTEASGGFIRTKVSPEFFKWRYLDHPFFHYGFHSFSSGSKWMTGIFSVVQKVCRKEMYLVDLSGHPECLSSFFRELKAIATKMGVSFIATILTSGYRMEDLWKQGFFKYHRKNMVALALNEGLLGKAYDLKYWKLVGGMHDTL